MSAPSKELEGIIKRLTEVYAHLRTNRRHLERIEGMAEAIKARVEALLPEPEPVVEEEAEG